MRNTGENCLRKTKKGVISPKERKEVKRNFKKKTKEKEKKKNSKKFIYLVKVAG